MLREEIRNIKSGRKELRSFGLTFGIVSAAVGGIMLWRGSGLYPYAFGAAILFSLLAFLWRMPLMPLQKIWMTLAAVLGFFMSRLILIVMFYLILTPVSLTALLFGKRVLVLKPDKNLASYWNVREKDPSEKPDYTKQY
jgi:hypothetical protein